MTGVVKFFDGERGYGFIIPDDGSKDVFFHSSAMEGAKVLRAGQMIEFDLFPHFPKPRALRVKPIERSSYERIPERAPLRKEAAYGD